MNVSGAIFFPSRAKETKKKKKMPDLRLTRPSRHAFDNLIIGGILHKGVPGRPFFSSADQKLLLLGSFLDVLTQLNFCPDFYRFRSVCHWRLLPNVKLIAFNSSWQCKTRPFRGKLLNLFRFQDDGVKLDPPGLLAGVCVCLYPPWWCSIRHDSPYSLNSSSTASFRSVSGWCDLYQDDEAVV